VLGSGWMGRWNGNLGPVYGYSGRNWNGETKIDHDKEVVNSLKTINSRRIVWFPHGTRVFYRHLYYPFSRMSHGKAACPMSCIFSFYGMRRKIVCSLVSRSADIFFRCSVQNCNLCLFTLMMAQVCELHSGEIHSYFWRCTHLQPIFEQVGLQLSRP